MVSTHKAIIGITIVCFNGIKLAIKQPIAIIDANCNALRVQYDAKENLFCITNRLNLYAVFKLVLITGFELYFK